MIIFLILAYFVIGALVARYIGRNVYKNGGFYSHSGVKKGDRDGALAYAFWHGTFWPVILYLLLCGSLVFACFWIFKQSAPTAARLFIGKKLLDKPVDEE